MTSTGNKQGNQSVIQAAIVPASTVFPPSGFYNVEFCVHRAFEPVMKEHLPFIKRLNLSSIIVLTDSPIDPALKVFAENEDITMRYILSGKESPFSSSVSLSEDWMKTTLQLILSLEHSKSLLLIGSPHTCIDAACIACLRKLQKWSFTSIIGEFRMLAGRKIFDMEQFIEYFDISLISLPLRLPEFISVYHELEREDYGLINDYYEAQLLEHQNKISTENIDNNNENNSSGVVEPAIEMKETSNKNNSLLKNFRILFSSPQICIQSSDQYDSNVSLITEENDD